MFFRVIMSKFYYKGETKMKHLNESDSKKRSIMMARRGKEAFKEATYLDADQGTEKKRGKMAKPVVSDEDVKDYDIQSIINVNIAADCKFLPDDELFEQYGIER